MLLGVDLTIFAVELRLASASPTITFRKYFLASVGMNNHITIYHSTINQVTQRRHVFTTYTKKALWVMLINPFKLVFSTNLCIQRNDSTLPPLLLKNKIHVLRPVFMSIRSLAGLLDQLEEFSVEKAAQSSDSIRNGQGTNAHTKMLNSQLRHARTMNWCACQKFEQQRTIRSK